MNKLLEFLNSNNNLRRLVELYRVNNKSFDIKQIGRPGLTPNEALDLTSMVQFCWGIMWAMSWDGRDWLVQVLENEVARIERGGTIHVPTEEEYRIVSGAARRAL